MPWLKNTDRPRGLAQVRAYLGAVLQWRGDYTRAEVQLQQGLLLAREAHIGSELGLNLFFLGHTKLSAGDYEGALRCYNELTAYAADAADKFYLARAPNCLGGIYLELYDLQRAVEANLQGEQDAHRLALYPEPRAHSLVKLGLAWLERDDHGRANRAFLQATELLDVDEWARWRWATALPRGQGELALAEGRLDDASRFAVEALAIGLESNSRKHIARAKRLQGEIHAAAKSHDEARAKLREAIDLAVAIGTPREEWLSRAALAKLLLAHGNDADAEAELIRAANIVEFVAGRIQTAGLRESFLNSRPVSGIFTVLKRRPQ